MASFTPLLARDFTPNAAAHLLWRAGFGGTWQEAVELADLGLDSAVDRLVFYEPSVNLPAPECASLPEESSRAFEERLRGIPDEEIRQSERRLRQERERAQIRDLKLWWLDRMVSSSLSNSGIPPLEEKLTLFWHSHFATGYEDKIQATFPLWQQNQMLRALAIRPLPDQLNALIRDPAMLVWLDNASSHRNNPNENFARELMELFSMGVGPYSEKDVKESARAFTGYSTDRETWTFQFREGAHDPGEKTFFGQTGPFRGEDIVRIICEHPSTATFMTRKFLQFFACTNPEEGIVEALADGYRSSSYNLRDLLRSLFRSQYFYSQVTTNAVVKSPVCLALGALKTMRSPMPKDEVFLGVLRVMGQDLFFPPDVNGWPGGGDWINSNTLLIRYNFANFLMHGVSADEFKTLDRKTVDRTLSRREFVTSERKLATVDWEPADYLKSSGEIRRMLTSKDIVDYFIREFLQREPSRDLRAALIQLAETDGAGGRRPISVRDSNFNERARGLVHLIMSSPDYQLC
ncbi:MAG: DUF1800 domain-containing protein [Terrimicrobiaceae bacterium]